MHPKQNSIGREAAIELASTKWWEGLTAEQIVKKQVYTAELVTPFEIFHEAVEKFMEQPVFTHQFGSVDFLTSIMEKVGEP